MEVSNPESCVGLAGFALSTDVYAQLPLGRKARHVMAIACLIHICYICTFACSLHGCQGFVRTDVYIVGFTCKLFSTESTRRFSHENAAAMFYDASGQIVLWKISWHACVC